jgi:hypothetical protein
VLFVTCLNPVLHRCQTLKRTCIAWWEALDTIYPADLFAVKVTQEVIFRLRERFVAGYDNALPFNVERKKDVVV